ncbi:MAG: cohesin domain-containing protein [Anaerolineae bacterium]
MRFTRVLVFLALLILISLPAVAVAQDATTVTLQPVAFVPVEGETFTTEVSVDNTQDLLGFQFDVNFDAAAFAVESIELGPFLSSTGRTAQPLGPDLRDAASGRVVYGGFTLGTPDQPGVAGSGVLATITWRVVKATDFTATLSRVQLAGPGGQALPGSDTSAAAPAPAATVTVEPTAVPAAPAATSDTSLPLPLLIVGGLVLAALLVILLSRLGRKAQ